jgi:hypothetical protein
MGTTHTSIMSLLRQDSTDLWLLALSIPIGRPNAICQESTGEGRLQLWPAHHFDQGLGYDHLLGVWTKL